MGRAAALREPAQARPPRALLRGAARPRRRGFRSLRPRPGRGGRCGVRGRCGGRGHRRHPSAHDPRREGARVQGRRRRGRGPPRSRAGRRRDPLPPRRAAWLPGRRPRERQGEEATPIGWVLARLDATELDEAGEGPLEIERNGARLVLRLDRFRGEEPPAEVEPRADGDPQLSLFAVENGRPAVAEAPKLPELEPVPEAPEHRVRRLSYSALALFESCSYRIYAERIVGLREATGAGAVPGQTGLAATEIGDAAHVLLEQVDLAAPRPPES